MSAEKWFPILVLWPQTASWCGGTARDLTSPLSKAHLAGFSSLAITLNVAINNLVHTPLQMRTSGPAEEFP